MKTRGEKRASTSEDPDSLQAANRRWWSSNPMTYDWSGKNPHAPHSREWFDHMDAVFVGASKHFATRDEPFDRLMGDVSGKKVLEIGCGSGFHAELLAKRGAHVTAIDITDSAIDTAKARFRLKGLEAEFMTWDAETPNESFDGQFDLVWSWGVVHHSARTGRVVRNVSHWLRPEGEFRGMVYHRDGVNFFVCLAIDWVLKRNMFKHSVDEALWSLTDGYFGRYYSLDQWRDLLLAFFEHADVRIGGEKAHVVALPRRLREPLLKVLPDGPLHATLERVGGFLLFEAQRPIR